MKELEIIRNLYKPIQPTVKAGGKKISYKEVQPTSKVSDFVYCFWQLNTIEQLDEAFAYRVVSDGCIDIFFELQNLSNSFAMGFHRKYTEFSIGSSFNYVGIRFLPSAFPILFNQSAKQLSNETIALSSILPEFAQCLSLKGKQKKSFKELTPWLEDRIRETIDATEKRIDSRFYNALIQIFERRGFLDLSKELNIGLSPRQLRRIFDLYIGTTPKAFSNVVRFQQILNAKPSPKSLRENKIYFDLGFFDQAHFIKTFKRFYGVTPSEALK